MVADAIGGAIRAPDASNPGTRSSRTQQFLVGSQIRGKQNGIPDYIGCGGDDGAVFVNHCAMLKRAGMAITFTAIPRGLLPRHACRGRQKLFAFSSGGHGAPGMAFIAGIRTRPRVADCLWGCSPAFR